MLFILFLQAVRTTLRVTAKHSCCSVLIRLVSDFRWAKMLLKCIWGFLLLSCHTVNLLLHVWGNLNSRTFEDTGLVNPSLWVQTTLALWCHVACVGFFSILMLKGSIHKSPHTTSTPVLSGLWMPPHGRSTHRTFQSVLKPSHTSNSATKKRDCSRGVMQSWSHVCCAHSYSNRTYCTEHTELDAFRWLARPSYNLACYVRERQHR